MMPLYDRATLVDVLVAHQRHNLSSCLCGWSMLGASHPEHIASEYEKAAMMVWAEHHA